MKVLFQRLAVLAFITLGACATQGNFVPDKVATTWYINGVDLDHEGRICNKQCLFITITENPTARAEGATVSYDLKQIPSLLQKFGVTRYAELIGKRITVADEIDPSLTVLVKEGRSCSEWIRISSPRAKAILGKNWC